MLRSWLPLCAVAVAACGQPFWTPRPEPPAPRVMEESDRRRSLLGSWQIAFAVDSTVARTGKRPRMLAGSGAWTVGVLTLTDSLNRAPPFQTVRGTVQVDFTSALGRQISCFHPEGREIWLQFDKKGHAMFSFTPGAGDCGFGASGSVRGDSVVGRWSEGGYFGPSTEGRFIMVRLSTSESRPPN